VVSTLAPAARKKGVTLQLDVTPSLSQVRGDPERLRQVFLNLVENAIKFTPAGGTVLLRARMADAPETDGDEEGLTVLAPTRARLEVRVIDSGIGIPVRERSKIFDAFYQVDSSSTRQHGGTGLGLSIAKRLVEGHGGVIRVEDNEPNGTVFVVSLPQPTPSIVPGPA
jgi:signal transduction histidine kinase